jgi:hypothetical protein
VVEYLLGKEEVTSSNLVTGLLIYPRFIKGFRLIRQPENRFALKFRVNGFLASPKPPVNNPISDIFILLLGEIHCSLAGSYNLVKSILRACCPEDCGFVSFYPPRGDRKS